MKGLWLLRKKLEIASQAREVELALPWIIPSHNSKLCSPNQNFLIPQPSRCRLKCCGSLSPLHSIDLNILTVNCAIPFYLKGDYLEHLTNNDSTFYPFTEVKANPLKIRSPNSWERKFFSFKVFFLLIYNAFSDLNLVFLCIFFFLWLHLDGSVEIRIEMPNMYALVQLNCNGIIWVHGHLVEPTMGLYFRDPKMIML